MENQKEKVVSASFLHHKNCIYEMLYNEKEQQTRFIMVENGGKMDYLNKIETEHCTYTPFYPTNPLLSKKVVLFPSEIEEYGSMGQLVSEVQAFIHIHVDISPFFEEIATYYVLLTWMYDKFNELPYLRALGDYGSGKSRFLQTIGSICYKPMFMGGSTTASPVFRIIDAFKGTLILDEADFRYSDMTSEITKILNSGYQKGVAVLRTEGKGTFDIKAYEVYCPKIIATREKFSDKALESRFLVEEMGGSIRNDIPRTLGPEFHQKALELRNKLLKWRLDNYFKEIKPIDSHLDKIHPRLRQIMIPVLAINPESNFRQRLEDFMEQYDAEMIEDRGLDVRSDIISIIFRAGSMYKKNKLTVKEIATEYNLETGFQQDYISPRKVGFILRSKLHLKPYKTRDGFVLDLEKDKNKLALWKERFGITDTEVIADMNNENDVNFVRDIK